MMNTDVGSWAKESFEIATKIAVEGGTDWDTKRWLHDGLRDGSKTPCFQRDTFLARAGFVNRTETTSKVVSVLNGLDLSFKSV